MTKLILPTNFGRMIKKIIKIGAPWCAPCKFVDNQLQLIHDIDIEQLNVDEDETLEEKYHIRNIPVLIFLDENNNEVVRKVGAITSTAIEDIIKEHEG